MLMLTLPKADTTGKCRINGQPAEFRLLGEQLEFRYEGKEKWDRRNVMAKHPVNSELVTYMCDNGSGR